MGEDRSIFIVKVDRYLGVVAITGCMFPCVDVGKEGYIMGCVD
jgi:hypothetical protein